MNITKFTLLTLNTFGMPILSPKLKERYALLCKQISSMSIDIANFQEVYSNLSLKRLVNGLPTFPYSVYEHNPISPKGGLVTFSKIPIKKISYTQFNTPFYKTFFKKGILVGQLANRIIIINTHFSTYHEHDSHSNQLCPTHLEEIHQLVKTINRNANQNPIIICGDFNISKQSNLYQTFLRLSQTKDIFSKTHSATYHREYLPHSRKAHCIDYIFIYDPQEKLTVKKKKLVFTQKYTTSNNSVRYLSDHVGLLTQFQLNQHQK